MGSVARTLDPQAQTTAWVQAMGITAPANYAKGIQNTTVNPMQLAAAAGESWIKGVQTSFTSGKWQAGLNSASVQTWKTNASTTGAQRLASGAQRSQQKYQAAVSTYSQFLQPILQQVAAMPSDTKSARIARATTYLNAVSQ